MYYVQLSGVTLLGTRVIKGVVISSITKSTVTTINRLDKIAGTIYLVS